MFLINIISIGLFLLLFSSNIVENSLVTFPLYVSTYLSSATDLSISSTRNNSIKSFSIYGRSDQGYYVTLQIGKTQKEVNVLVDTGSSNFAIAAAPNNLIKRYFNPDNSPTFQHKNINITVPYTKGIWEGYLGTDFVTVPGFEPVRIDIACITESTNFFINGSEWEGILGLGYAAIVKPYNVVKPLFDTLVETLSIQDIFSIQLCSSQYLSKSAGSLCLGGISPQFKYDKIFYTPLHREWYYDIVLTEIAVGNKTLLIDCKELNNNKTIVDSGTTNMRLPRKVFTAVLEALQEQIEFKNSLSIPSNFWEESSFLCLNNAPSIKNFPKIRLSVLLSVNSTFTLVISPDQYLRKVTDAVESNFNCYAFAISPSDTGTVIGALIMQGFLVVFDREKQRVGFANSDCNHNFSYSKIEGPFYHPDPWSCAYKYETNSSTKLILYVAIVLAFICIIPILILIVCNIKNKLQHIFQRKGTNLIEE